MNVIHWKKKNFNPRLIALPCIALSTQQTGQMWGRGIWTVNTIHLAVPAGFHTSQLDLHAIYRFSYNYFVTGEEDKADFSIPCEIPQIFNTV
jgi:hypothetical protein